MVTSAVVADDVRVVRGGREVLHGLTFQVSTGQITGLLGPSGGGKTTLMRAMVGVQAGVSGRLVVLGQPAGSASLRSRLGYVTQSPAVYGDLSVRDNLDYFAAVLGAPHSRVNTVLADVALANSARRRVDTLSGGERARVSLATAMLGEPELLVLDEPTVGLDPVLRRDLWVLFRRLADAGRTLIVSSHVMDEASRCDRLLLLRDGRLVADDTLDALLVRTGAGDVEQAFLVLAERQETLV
jgi:ABC-2 type transport system ATP-binding protein